METSNALVAAISALATGVVLVPATYLINDFLARDHIGIEAIEFQPDTTDFEPNPAIMQTLASPNGGYEETEFGIWIEGQGQQRQDLFKNHTASFDESDRQNLEDALVDFNHYLDERLSAANALQVRWAEAIKNAPTWPIPPGLTSYVNPRNQNMPLTKGAPSGPKIPIVVLRPPEFQNVIDVLVETHDSRIVTLEGPPSMTPPDREYVETGFTRKIADLQKTKQLVTDLEKAARDFKEDRTGNLWIHVTLINSGGTDGLVQSRGKLELVDRGDSVPILEKDGAVTKVEKRSVAEAWFQIDERTASKNAAEEVHKLVQKGSNVLGIVELKDFRDKVLASSKTPLPLAP